MKENKFLEQLTTPLASFLKVFLSTTLTMWIAMPDLFDFTRENLENLATAGIISAMPMVLNYLNPAYKNYGRIKSDEKTKEESK